MIKMIRQLWLLFFLLNTTLVFSQIQGRVLDMETEQPLFGAHILADTESGVTDEQGRFELTQPTRRIIVSYLSYLTDTLFIEQLSDLMTIYLKPDFYHTKPIIVRGGLNDYPLVQMPASVGYMDDLEDQNQDPINFLVNLNQVPGIMVQNGTANTNRITIRGVGSRTPYGSNRIKAYFQGIPISSGDGSTEIEDINSSVIGSVEVLKGSKSALYGSGLGGVILLNLPTVKNGFYGGGKFHLGSFDTYKAEAGLQYGKQGFKVNSQYSKARSAGWRENSKYEREQFLLHMSSTKKKTLLGLTILATRVNAQIPSSLNEVDFEESPESAAPNWLNVEGFEKYDKFIGGFHIKHWFSDRFSNSTHLFFQYYQGYESRPFNILDDEAQKWGLRNITAFQLDQWKLQWGMEALFETYEWQIFETNDGVQGQLQRMFLESRVPINLFLNIQYQFSNEILIEAGLSMNTLSYQLTDQIEPENDLSGEYRYDWVWSPFIGLNFPLSHQTRLYTSLSHGFSAPSLEETLLPEGNINPELKPETAVNLEAGIRYQSQSGRFFIDAGIYQLWIHNLLLTKRESEEVFYGDNAGKSNHRGIEISSRFQMIPLERKFPLSLHANYHLIRAVFTDFVDDGQDFSKHSLPGIPRQNMEASALISSSFGVNLEWRYQWVGQQYLNDANDQSYGAYHLFHMKLAYSKRLKIMDLELALGIRNLLDSKHASMILVNAPSFGGNLPRYYYPGMPRNYFLTLSIQF